MKLTPLEAGGGDEAEVNRGQQATQGSATRQVLAGTDTQVL